MKHLHFKDNFWNNDLTSTAGYDAIIQYHNEGKRTCKEVEDFLKARAGIEEKYAKDLLGLSKKVCGHSEMNTLKRSLDIFKLQMENVSLAHLQLAQSMREEVKKLEEFRERQKEARKKIEQHMDALHKQKVSQFKKTLDSKKTYEQKCRDKEEADQNVYRNTNNSKNIEKVVSTRFNTFTPFILICMLLTCIAGLTNLLFKFNAKAQQAKLNSEEADRSYQQNVSTLGNIRDEWLKEHMNACEILEKQAIERINFVRNTVWTHLNLLSQQCVTSDELYEEVRKSLEQCNIQEDIDHFVNLRRTGDKPPGALVYENFYSGQRASLATPLAPQMPPPVNRREALPVPGSPSGGPIYSTVQDTEYSVVRH
ncbi:proline-serine-threonine phosphatase-interacting protein 2 isoform X3 [Boleophthalmus pectinirostris]|uniref:proline-serine-threonine phosphatase-interacting protein 2 isoform X3 n=1 Tax=Boleophthalmus pectinirostris TaxID=150288 RepID=UPI00242B270D|nr:proline-serine-threonine phosphatase-interacting protein 2 isoform X3 [Boleophthalmus pectinirostris]